MRQGAHKSAEFVIKNSLGQVPVLELDDGSTLSESVAICRYLEELHPAPPLFGDGAWQRARVEMWTRRIEFGLMSRIGAVWVNTHIPFVSEMPHGGFKHSGYGKDLSLYGMEDYTRIKHVMANIES